MTEEAPTAKGARGPGVGEEEDGDRGRGGEGGGVRER